MVDLTLMAGAMGIFIPSLLIAIMSGRNFNTFLGWCAVFMFVAAAFGAVPLWFEYLAIVLGGVFLYLKVFSK